MKTLGGNTLAPNFGRRIWGDQVPSPNATNVIAVVGTNLKYE